MHFTVFALTAIAAMTSAYPTEAPSGEELFARDEYRWCLGEKINLGTLRKFNFRMRDIDTDNICQQFPFDNLHNCLGMQWCAPSGGGFNCGKDAKGYIHGGINVGLGCSGESVKYCLDKTLGMAKGNSDYVCNKV